MIAPRFLVLVSRGVDGEPIDTDGIAAATGLILEFQTSRLLIFTDHPRHCVPLETGEGAFVGNVFPNEPTLARLSSISRGTSHAILASAGAHALKAYWGGYVLACDDPYHDILSVARDPSGALPCYFVECEPVIAFSSDPRTLAKAGFLTPAIDFPLLYRHLAHIDLCLPDTCLAGVRELLPGTRFEWSRDIASVRTWWSPWIFANDPLSVSNEDLAVRLRETVDGCVTAWASRCNRVLVSLSGGLDSSIVTSALSRSTAAVSAFTMVGDDADGDERAYAGLVATRFGIDLHEARFDPAAVDVRKAAAPHLPRPVGTIHMQSLEVASRAFSDWTGADAFFNGMAGDSIFCSMRSALAVADSCLARRPPVAIWRTARDVARLVDVSTFSVGRQALRMLLRGRRPLRADGVGSFLTSEARAEMPELAYSQWFAIPQGTPPGRAYHVEMIARLQSFVEGFDRWTAPPTVAALFSQPILELCLRIPSWAWVAGGRNRAVARQAFSDSLPPAISQRRSKGGPDAMSVAVCLDNLGALREILLDGELARRGALDRIAVERTLTRDAILQHGKYQEILILADAEAWIRHWANFDRDLPSSRPMLN